MPTNAELLMKRRNQMGYQQDLELQRMKEIQNLETQKRVKMLYNGATAKAVDDIFRGKEEEKKEEEVKPKKKRRSTRKAPSILEEGEEV